MLLYLLQFASSTIIYAFFRKNEMRYFAMITFCYFIAYFYSGSYDVPLSVYAVFVFLKIGIPSKMNLIVVVLVGILGIYTIVGILFQEAFATMTTFITRYAYILIFFFYLNGKTDSYEPSKQDYRFLVDLGQELLRIIKVLEEE